MLRWVKGLETVIGFLCVIACTMALTVIVLQIGGC
jgi:preprotein translocase subunit SecE